MIRLPLLPFPVNIQESAQLTPSTLHPSTLITPLIPSEKSSQQLFVKSFPPRPKHAPSQPILHSHWMTCLHPYVPPGQLNVSHTLPNYEGDSLEGSSQWLSFKSYPTPTDVPQLQHTPLHLNIPLTHTLTSPSPADSMSCNLPNHKGNDKDHLIQPQIYTPSRGVHLLHVN